MLHTDYTDTPVWDDLEYKATISHLSLNVIHPAVSSAFTIHGHRPEWLKVTFESSGADHVINCLIRIFAYRTGIAEFALLYNTHPNRPDTNRFVKLIISSTEPIISESKHQVTISTLLKMIVTLATDMNIVTIIAPDVAHMTSPPSDVLDLFMTMYTNQSIYSTLGFVLLNYPSLVTQIRTTLYTPLNELNIPTPVMTDLNAKMGISPQDTLNTLLYFVYPLYVDHKLTDVDKSILRKLYKILVKTHDHVKQYTNVMVYTPYMYPRPGVHIIPEANHRLSHEDTHQSVNVLNLMNRIDKSIYDFQFPVTYYTSHRKTAKRIAKKSRTRSSK